MEHIIQRDEKGHFLPGSSGNPTGIGGREIGSVSLVTLLRKRLQEHPEDAQDIVNSLVTMGKSRELGAIKELLDRIDGKVVETHKIEGELPVKLIFIAAGEGRKELAEGTEEDRLSA